MQQAFILISADPGKLWMIEDSASKVRGVKIASAVTGAFDVIVYVEVADISELGGLITAIQSIDGVNRTQTAICMKHPAWQSG